MVCLPPESWETSSSSDTDPPTPPSPQPPSPKPTPNLFGPIAQSFPSRIPQWDIQQINPNFASTSSFSFTSPPKDNPHLGPKPPPPERNYFNRNPLSSSNRLKMGRTTSEDAKSDMEKIHQILSTTLMSQKYATSFHQQQVCTEPSSRTYTFDDADEDGVINIAIDAEQRLKDFMESCNSCDNLGDQMSKIVHGQCVELFRIRCDEGENGERRIQGIELDLRQLKRPEVGQVIGDSQSARLKLLEARMRGTDSSTAAAEEDDIWLDNDDDDEEEEEDLGSLGLLQGIQNIAEKYQDRDGEKRRRLDLGEEVVIKSTAKTGEEAAPKESKDSEKNDDKPRATSLITKTVPLIQPRNRTSKPSSSIQMVPQPKKSKKKNKNKKKKEKKDESNATEVTRIVTPMESITIYDAPTEGDPSLRNPQTAWAQRQGNELTITQRREQISSNAQNIMPGNGGEDISGLAYGDSADTEREKYRNLYSVQPPHENPRTNVFILYSTEDEKASPHHRPDIFTTLAKEISEPKPIMGSVKPIEPDDDFKGKEISLSDRQGTTKALEHEVKEGKGNLVKPPSAIRSHEEMDNDVATAMEALRLEDGNTGNLDLEATLDVLRRDQERVSAEINRLLEVQEKTREQDREVDRLLAENNIPSVKYKITEPGEQFSLSQTLDDLIDIGAQNAPSFEPQSPEYKNDIQLSSALLYVSSDRCKQPTEQQKQEWLDSIASSSTPSTSAGESESDLGDSVSQPDISYFKDGNALLSGSSQGTQGLDMAGGLTTTVPVTLITHLKYPPNHGTDARHDNLVDDIPTPPVHPGINTSPEAVRPLFERLGDEFEKLDTSITRKGGKKQKIKSGIVRKEWTRDMQEAFESSYPQGKRRIDGVEGTIVEICDNDSSVSELSAPDENQPIPALTPDTNPLIEPQIDTIDAGAEIFKIPTTGFTVESDLVIDTKAAKPKVSETPLRLKVPPKTPLKSILKKTSQFATGTKSIVVETVGSERELGHRPKTPKRPEAKGQEVYAKLPFPSVPFKGVAGSNNPYRPKIIPKKERKPEPPKLTEEQQYQMAVAKLSELPGFVEEDISEKDIVKREGLIGEDVIDKKIPPTTDDESEEEFEEGTEDQKAIKRAIKGKAVDRESWLGFDCRFYELNSSTPFERSPPSPQYPLRPMRLQDDLRFTRAIHESLVEAEKEFSIWKRSKLATPGTHSESELSEASSEMEPRGLLPEKIKRAEDITDSPEEEYYTFGQDNMEQASAAQKLADSADIKPPVPTYLPTSLLDEDDEDPFAPAEERARKEAEKAKL
ncbi:hypothetical protein TWF506_004647 [Arthrobotrys conoides]|uniref:Uncharacterized protein n=1 Tax=Arthrobotrys conoides TaxID=74498 RepID=A0AAN8N222_9PEZI